MEGGSKEQNLSDEKLKKNYKEEGVYLSLQSCPNLQVHLRFEISNEFTCVLIIIVGKKNVHRLKWVDTKSQTCTSTDDWSHTCSNACSQFHTYQASSNILLQCAMCMLVKYGLLIVADLLYPKLQWWPVVREALPPMTRLGIAKRGLTMNQPRNATHGMQLTVTHAMHVLNSCNNKPNNRIRTKEWLLRLETLQTFEFDQNDKYKND